MKKRIMSIIVAGLIFVPIIIVGGYLYKAATLILGMIALKELLDIRESKREFPIFAKLLAYFITIMLITNNMLVNELVLRFDYKIIAALLLFITIPLVIYSNKDIYNINDCMYLIGSTLIVGTGFNLLIIIRNYELLYLIYLFLITASTDTFAYIGGMLSGRHKLCPNISPNKTIEGAIVGTMMGTLIASTFYYIFIDDLVNVFNIIAITMFLSFVGQMGDLVCSSIKRYFDKKDFSNIMPGHGGILDRLNSTIFVLLAFLFFISII